MVLGLKRRCSGTRVTDYHALERGRGFNSRDWQTTVGRPYDLIGVCAYFKKRY